MFDPLTAFNTASKQTKVGQTTTSQVASFTNGFNSFITLTASSGV